MEKKNIFSRQSNVLFFRLIHFCARFVQNVMPMTEYSAQNKRQQQQYIKWKFNDRISAARTSQSQ